MTTRNIAAIVLAAGTSSRFGPANKLLATYRGKPMICHAIKNIELAGFADIYIVSGFESKKIREILKGKRVTFVPNPEFKSGIASSIRAGIKALPPDCRAALIALGDMPGVSPDTIKVLMAAPSDIAIPVFAGKRGNPVLWRREAFDALLSVEGDSGGKQVISQYSGAVTEVPVDDRGILFDLDTSEALDAASKDT